MSSLIVVVSSSGLQRDNASVRGIFTPSNGKITLLHKYMFYLAAGLFLSDSLLTISVQVFFMIFG